jgi:hypothetical protein
MFRLLIHYLEEGKIDGLTVIFHQKVNSWVKIGDVPELKVVIQEIAAEEETRVKYLESVPDTDQVYEYSANAVEGEIQAMPPEPKRYFTADNGKRYVWDNAENDWVEDEGILSDSEDSNEGAVIVGGGKSETNVDKIGPGSESVETANPKKRKKKNKQKNTSWKSNSDGLWIYVTGLPSDVTVEEIKSHFSKVC